MVRIYQAAAVVLLSAILFLSLNIPTAKSPGAANPASPPPVQKRVQNPCLQAPLCSQPVPVTVLQLVTNANRYDRKTVRVKGKVQMLKLRKTACGNYSYFIIKDDEGYFISVTDYTSNRDYVESHNPVEVVGFYRAEMHNIDVCRIGTR